MPNQSKRFQPNLRGSCAGPRSRRFAVGRHEQSVGVPELAAHGFARCMKSRRGRGLGLLRLLVRILGQDGGWTQRSGSRLLSSHGGFELDVINEGRDSPAPLRFRQMLPAWKRIELQGFPRGEMERIKFLPSTTGRHGSRANPEAARPSPPVAPSASHAQSLTSEAPAFCAASSSVTALPLSNPAGPRLQFPQPDRCQPNGEARFRRRPRQWTLRPHRL